MISDTLKEISSKYLDEKNTSIANNEFAGFVRDAAQKYIKFVEKFVEAKVSAISTSPERKDTILLEDPFEA